MQLQPAVTNATKRLFYRTARHGGVSTSMASKHQTDRSRQPLYQIILNLDRLLPPDANPVSQNKTSKKEARVMGYVRH